MFTIGLPAEIEQPVFWKRSLDTCSTVGTMCAVILVAVAPQWIVH